MAIKLFQIPIEWDAGCRAARYQANRMCSETDDAYVYSFIVPGVNRDSMDVGVYRNRLTVKVASSPSGKAAEMEESLWLPRNVNVGGITASSKDGVLTVTVPKAVEKKRVAVPVEDSMDRDENAHEIEVEVPGGTKDDVVVEVEEGKVFVKVEAKEGSYFRSFERVFHIPLDGDNTSVRAFCKFGLLVVQIRKIEATTLSIAESEPTVAETEHVVRVKMPGVPIENIEVRRLGKYFRLRTSCAKSSAVPATFEQTFMLPEEVEADNAQAFYNNGVLNILAPKIQFERTKVEVTE